MSGDQKSQFENTRGGYVGIVKLNMKGEPEGAAVGPGETVWLSEKEQALTAEAPRHEADNPFTNGSLTLRVRAADVPTVRPIGDSQDMEAPPAAPDQPEEEYEEVRVEQAGADGETDGGTETGAAEEPTGKAPEGQRATNEEFAADTTVEREAGHRPSGSPLAAPAAPVPDPLETKSTD